ncbi:Phosphodiesterase [Sergentomyia squamirostris]
MQKFGRIPTTTTSRRMSDSDKDRPLLEALISGDEQPPPKIEGSPRRRHACNGRFLTMHKRRRKKLTTRSLMQDVAILDDILHGQVQCILNQVGNWRFNAFTLETVTGGRSLPVLCVHLFHWYGLLDHFNLDVVRLWKLFTLIEEGYHSTNPYHNAIHATDVTQAMHCFLQERKILEHLEPLEIMASLIGAVTHDLDHPGVNQPFLIATSNHLAALYENTSVLENHHWRSAVGCLLESGVAEQIQNIRPELERQISSLILATDITRQQEFLCKFRNYLNTSTLDMRQAEHRHFILQIALKCADISNPCRPWDVSKKWSQKVCEEFFRQGDYERQLNLPVTSLCDRFSTTVPKIQVGFFKYVVTPLFDEWHRFLTTDLSTKMMGFLKYNQVQWETRVATELAEETRTEISDAELLEEDEDEEEDGDIVDQIDGVMVRTEEEEPCVELSDSSEVLIPTTSCVKLPRRSSLQVPRLIHSRHDRRHSMPVNAPRIILTSRDHASGSTIQEDVETHFDDSFSLLSSDSDSGPRARSSGESVPDRERPLSAETLVPDLSIATMTDSICANRLNFVMHGGSVGNTSSLPHSACSAAAKQLVRQQTFPPLQPYIRTRYMSTTAELGGCAEALAESRSSSSDSQCDEQRGVLISKKESFKRSDQDFAPHASSKMAKLAIVPGQKENLDPTILRRTLNKRRGSAPVTTLGVTTRAPDTSQSVKEPVTLVIRSCGDHLVRRGSMPADAIKITSVDVGSQSDNGSTPAATPASLNTIQRRSSMPCENLAALGRSNGKSRNRKKLLRRRSSGGAEILSPILTEESTAGASSGSGGSAWFRFKRDITRSRTDQDTLLTRRRGSLPVEVLAVGLSGTMRH